MAEDTLSTPFATKFHPNTEIENSVTGIEKTIQYLFFLFFD